MKTYIVDSFTSEVFKGNPAGVCLVGTPLAESMMHSIAKELNYSETAFVIPRDQPNCFSIRYFSPVTEIPLCGHATLASSKVIFSDVHPESNTVEFTTGQGLELKCKRSGDLIEMSFPVYEVEPAEPTPELLESLGIAETNNCAFNQETGILLLEIASTELLSNLKPDFVRLVNSYQGIRGVLVTAAANDEYDFHSRYFWPWSGGEEDPVTGGTHTFLAKYWSQRLGRTKLKSFQSSARTGSMDLELADGILVIKSQAVIVLKGDWIG